MKNRLKNALQDGMPQFCSILLQNQAQDDPGTPQEAPRDAPTPLKTPPGRPKTQPGRPKTQPGRLPRRPQDAPRRAKNAARHPKTRPRRPDRLQEPPRLRFWRIFDRFLVDFWLIFRWFLINGLMTLSIDVNAQEPPRTQHSTDFHAERGACSVSIGCSWCFPGCHA